MYYYCHEYGETVHTVRVVKRGAWVLWCLYTTLAMAVVRVMIVAA
jgi:hypothetical protein